MEKVEEFIFDKEKHEYRLDGRVLPSVTQILEATLFDKKYDGVDEEVLKKAAEYGSLIHKEIEEYIKTGVIGFTEEVAHFIKIKEENNLNHLESEIMVYDSNMAGTIDLMGYKDDKQILADIKTTYKLDKEYVSWQLSLYAYIIDPTYERIEELYAIWLRGDKCSFEKVERKSEQQILDVLSAFVRGTKIYFTPTTLESIPLEQQTAFCQYMKQIRTIEEKTKEIKGAILLEMENRGISKIDLGDITITYKKPSTKTSVDTKKLKEANLYDKYTKTSAVKSSITIKLKDEK